MRYRAPDGESAVTPVIGAVLILGISVLGIAGVLVWGAPMIDRIQSQNAQVAMVAEFEDLRDSSRELSVPDHSRFPTIVIPRGEVILDEGSRIMVTADMDTANLGCDFHVTDWADLTDVDTVTVDTTGCRGGAVRIYSLSGSTLVSQTVTATAPTYSVTGADFSDGDWLFELYHDACPDDACSQAWLHSGDQVSWSLGASTGDRTVAFDSGAIFSETEGTQFLEREPLVGDITFGSDYFGFWLRSLSAASYSSISGAGSHQVYLSLVGSYDRIDASSATRLRFDIAGDLSEAWCNALVQRNPDLPGDYYGSEPDDCGAVTGDGVRSVCYARVSGDPCTVAPTLAQAFSFRFLHARIYTSLAI